MSTHIQSLESTVDLAAYELGEAWVKALGRPANKLRLTVGLEACKEINPHALYTVLAEARLRDKRTLVYRTTQATDRVPALLGLSPLEVTGGTDWRYFGGTIDKAAHLAFEACTPEARDAIASHFVEQIERTVAKYVREFFQGSWATAVRTRELGRQQYVNTLQNMHQYVRFTTRLLGRAVACSHSTRLRAHYASHLRGEVNHELQLERDLEHMGENTEFLRTLRYANPSTRTFMSLEQSLVSFELDPVMFAACPIVAESFSAHLKADFLESLRETVASYGVAKPALAMTFFNAHVEADGGDDGHWAATRRLLEEHLTSEIRLGEFLSLMELAAKSFTASFNDSVDELGLFAPIRNLP